MRKYRRVVALGLIVFGAVVLAALLDAAGELTGVSRFEDFTLDLRQQTTPESFQPGRGARESEIALVLFDEYTVMDPVDGWPWISPFPRAHLAELIDALAAAGARTIGLDVYLDRLFPGLNAIDRGDELLRAAIERAGNVVLVTPVVATDSGPVASPPHPYFAEVAAGVGSAELPASFETFRDGTLAVRSAGGLEPSFALALWAHARGLDVDSLLAAALRTGRIDLPGLPERVGRIPEEWRAPPEGAREPGGGSSGAPAVARGAAAPPTPTEATAAHDASTAPDAPAASGAEPAADPPPAQYAPGGAAGQLARAVAGAIVPFRIRYVGPPSSADADAPPGTFQASAAGTVPEVAALLPELFRDRIVLLGTGFHEQDRFRTPFFPYLPPEEDQGGRRAPYGWMYGVEVHANALQNMLDGEYVRPLGPLGTGVLLLLVATAAAAAAFRGGPAWGAAATLGACLAAVVWAWWAWAGVAYAPWGELFTFDERFTWVPVGSPLLSGILAYVGSVAYVAVVEGKDKRFIKSAFGKYVSPEVVNEIAENPAALRLGGQKRPLTLLFSDLAGFTTLSENLDPEDLLALLNEYLDEMTEVVLEEQGYLDKYIGDAIMAFWNAPKAVEDHADRALRVAVVMQRRMRELNRRWRERDAGPAQLAVRVGVHTGEVVVGNVGGEERFNYSAIGDAVNLAARLEPANKSYATRNMVSEETLRHAHPERYRLRELDIVAVVGKVEPVKVFELLELAGVALEPALEAALPHYEAGMKAYRARDWAGALEHFRRALAACPDDGPSGVYARRCEDHLASPPPPDWDFVVQRTEK